MNLLSTLVTYVSIKMYVINSIMSVDQRFSSSCAAHHRGVLSSKEVRE